jgi:hypothetical protein
MPRLTDLSIPPEFAAFFEQILSLGNTGTTVGYKARPSSGDSEKRAGLRSISLFVLWQYLYDGLSSGRHAAWSAYWITLPFGSHSGANGWPGSGFSAFVYVNAPRYKLGQDLLLDPPRAYGPELLVNPNFDGNADGWSLGGYNPPAYTDHAIVAYSADDFQEFLAMQTAPMYFENYANYHWEIDAGFNYEWPYGEVWFNFGWADEGGPSSVGHDVFGVPMNSGVVTHYEGDWGGYSWDPDTPAWWGASFIQESWPGRVEIRKMSVRKIL